MATAREHAYNTTVTTSTSATYCTCGSELERKVGPVELLELLAAHHLAAAYCGMDGSEIDLNFVSREGTGDECHRMDGPAYGFTYTNERGGEGTFVRLGEESHAERISTVVHEVRHRWQFDAAHGLSFATEDAAEADAYAFMDEYAPKIGAQMSELTDKAAEWVKTAETGAPCSTSTSGLSTPWRRSMRRRRISPSWTPIGLGPAVDTIRAWSTWEGGPCTSFGLAEHSFNVYRR